MGVAAKRPSSLSLAFSITTEKPDTAKVYVSVGGSAARREQSSSNPQAMFISSNISRELAGDSERDANWTRVLTLCLRHASSGGLRLC
ncbi:hypothetical protein PoB_001451600 [Plakobranchus ocellatus]|uniref:Uncharacterized protein n=1 Tax=Plakobranchus ocellatus TaxID=259542 RepID=A0AAV3YL41_9GAST|nr:hypothetical protein PoB_001451600 [Plakobranchus ocellatus]